MANKTTGNLELIKPNFGEFTNGWQIPMNSNADAIDAAITGAQDELLSAAGSATDLTARLAVGIDPLGNLIASPEIVNARDSSIYGYANGNSFLNDRIEQGDREAFNARQGLASLLAILAFTGNDSVPNSVISAPSGFLNFTGANVKVDGSVTPVICNINGFRQVVRTLLTTPISGGAGTYYIYLAIQAGGQIYLDHTPSASNTGSISSYAATNELQKFTDSSVNFVLAGVQPGDVLDITSAGSANLGRYVVLATNTQDSTNLTVNDVAVISIFPSAQSNLNYKFTNLISPTLNVTPTAHPLRFAAATNQIFIGRAIFDGTNITSVYNYALKGRFEAFFQVTLTGGSFAQTINHQLGFFPSKIQFFASQANDYSQVMQPMSPDGILSGDSLLSNALVTNMNDTQINVKNASSGLFYQDYNGTNQTTGYLLVRCER